MRSLSLCGVAGSMRTMTRFQRKNGYKAKNLLNNKQEDSVFLINMRPLTGEHQTNGPLTPTTPNRGGARAIGQRVRAAIGRIWTFKSHKITITNPDDVDGQIHERLNVRQPYIQIPYTSKAELDKMMEDKQKLVTPSTTEDHKTVQDTTMEDEQKTVQSEIMEDNTAASPSTVDNNAAASPSTQDNNTAASPSTEDNNTAASPSIEDNTTAASSSTEDNNTAASPSTEDNNTAVSPSTEDNNTAASPSTEDIKTAVSASTEDNDTLISLRPAYMPKTAVSPSTEDNDTLISLRPAYLRPANLKVASPVPSSTIINVPSCVLSFEQMTCYRILGQGCIGKVMLASHPDFDQKLAVKIVQKRKLLEDNDDNCEMVFLERDVLKAAGKSPFIIHLFVTFQTKSHLAFVMECMSRGNLLDTMARAAPLSKDSIRYFIAEMVCGLQFLHSKEIVHRDIKPENILLNDDGHIKIADFGLAVIGVTESKRIQKRVGTAVYNAPEVLQQVPYYGMADYYSLGVIVYEMAFGRHPLLTGFEDLEELRVKVTTMEPKYLRSTDSNLRDIIERFLCKDQEKRMRLVRYIRQQPFLSKVDWKETEKGKSPPPFPSGHVYEEHLSEGLPVDEFIQYMDPGRPIAQWKQNKFHGFTYLSEHLSCRQWSDNHHWKTGIINTEHRHHHLRSNDITREPLLHHPRGFALNIEPRHHHPWGNDINKEPSQHHPRGNDINKELSHHNPRGNDIKKEPHRHPSRGNDFNRELGHHYPRAEPRFHQAWGNDINRDPRHHHPRAEPRYHDPRGNDINREHRHHYPRAEPRYHHPRGTDIDRDPRRHVYLA